MGNPDVGKLIGQATIDTHAHVNRLTGMYIDQVVLKTKSRLLSNYNIVAVYVYTLQTLSFETRIFLAAKSLCTSLLLAR